MSYTYPQARKAFKNDQISELASDPDGIRFLKLRSLSRSSYLKELIQNNDIETDTNYQRDLLKGVYQSDISESKIEKYIRDSYKKERKTRLDKEDELVSELYKIKAFDWGGLHQNSLERTIVNNYVKKIKTFDKLSEKIENELHNSLRAYVLSSWYNHWTSILIEDIFKDHESVLPAIGLIKKIDFFIGNIPFDLKVTYLPEGYIKDRRREDDLTHEITLLKRKARELDVHYDRDLPNSKLLEDLWSKLSDHPNKEAKDLVNELKDKRLEILNECINDSSQLIKWLYENQGVRRFDSSNRLFLILVNKDDFFNSWKLKRAKPLLEEIIHQRLTDLSKNPGAPIKFNWQDSEYTTMSEAIIITPEN